MQTILSQLSQTSFAARETRHRRARQRRGHSLLGLLAVGGFTLSQSLVSAQTADGFNPGVSSPAVPSIYAVARQADGKMVVGGAFQFINGQRRLNIARLNTDGTVDLSFNPGAGADANGGGDSFSVEALAVQADGKILVGGRFSQLGGQPRDLIGRLNPDGSLDTAFNPGANSDVYAFAVQPDGKILVGGRFTQLAGQPRSLIGRLNANGTIDNGFSLGAAGPSFPAVRALALQPDGKIVVGGTFTQLGGSVRNNIGRIETTNGVADSTFNPGANSAVYALTVQGDGGIVVGGFFTQLAGVSRSNIGRLNTGGTLDTTFNPGANGGVTALVLQVDGKIVAGGYFSQLAGQPRNFLGRLNGDGALDGPFNPGANNIVLALALQADAQIVAGGNFTELGGQPRTSLGRLKADGTLDTAFSPQILRFVAGEVEALAVQADGKVLIGGYFTQLGGQPRNNIGRVNPDGTIDSAFNPGANGAVRAMATQPDGKIVISGDFLQFGGQASNRINRLNPDGTPDPTFNLGVTMDNSPVALAVQPDGKILLGGFFTQLGGQPRNGLGRLNSDGTLDMSFNPGGGGSVLSIAVQTDAKVVVGGTFTQLGGQPRNCIGRFNGDGTLDSSLNMGTDTFGYVSSVKVQGDGRIVLGGRFSQLAGQARSLIGRLNLDGTLDTTFNPGAGGGANPYVLDLAIQPDGKIVAGGNFTQLGGQPRNRLGRFSTNGTLDLSFNPDVSGSLPDATPLVRVVAVQSDGRILVGGNFTQIAGQPRNNIARLVPLLQAEAAVSRKTHTGAGDFDVTLPLTGGPGVESRNSGGNHTLIFTFSNNVPSGNVSVTSGTATLLGTPSFAGNTITVNLSSVPDAQKVTLTFGSVTDSFGQVLPDYSVTVGFLVADSNGDRNVNSGDALETRNRSGLPISVATFRSDYNLDGFINSGDATIVRNRSGQAIPLIFDGNMDLGDATVVRAHSPTLIP